MLPKKQIQVKVMVVLPCQKAYNVLVLTLIDKVKILDLLKGSMSSVEAGQHYGGKNESSIHSI
jgi:hypothetical protein